MSEAEILKNILSVSTELFDDDGISFVDHFADTRSQWPAEILLFSCPDRLYKKWYYNYTEKMLRYIKTHDKTVADPGDDGSQVIFEAINDEDESSISFTAGQIADKILVYQDYQRLITYDKSTGHYEQFLIDIDKESADIIVEDFSQHFNIDKSNHFHPDTMVCENLQSIPTEDDVAVYDDEPDKLDEVADEEEVSNEEFRDAAKVIIQYLQETPELSEIRFQRFEDGVKLDLINSLFYNCEEQSLEEFDIEPDDLP